MPMYRRCPPSPAQAQRWMRGREGLRAPRKLQLYAKGEEGTTWTKFMYISTQFGRKNTRERSLRDLPPALFGCHKVGAQPRTNPGLNPLKTPPLYVIDVK
jgi:hypothetical protein